MARQYIYTPGKGMLSPAFISQASQVSIAMATCQFCTICYCCREMGPNAIFSRKVDARNSNVCIIKNSCHCNSMMDKVVEDIGIQIILKHVLDPFSWQQSLMFAYRIYPCQQLNLL